MQPRTHAPGTMQLDAFVGEGTLTAGPPPDLAFEDTMEPLPQAEEDAEERWMDDAPWADEEAYLLADMQDQAPPASTTASAVAEPTPASTDRIFASSNLGGGRHEQARCSHGTGTVKGTANHDSRRTTSTSARG